MATTTILIRDELGLRVPSAPRALVVTGDVITFTADPALDSSLYFSQSSAQILAPPPESPVSLPSGASVTYTFGEPTGQAYGVIVQAPDVPAPTDFDFGPPGDPPTLVIQPGERLPPRQVPTRNP